MLEPKEDDFGCNVPVMTTDVVVDDFIWVVVVLVIEGVVEVEVDEGMVEVVICVVCCAVVVMGSAVVALPSVPTFGHSKAVAFPAMIAAMMLPPVTPRQAEVTTGTREFSALMHIIEQPRPPEKSES